MELRDCQGWISYYSKISREVRVLCRTGSSHLCLGCKRWQLTVESRSEEWTMLDSPLSNISTCGDFGTDDAIESAYYWWRA